MSYSTGPQPISGFTGISPYVQEELGTAYRSSGDVPPALCSYVSGYTAANSGAYWEGVHSPIQDKIWWVPHNAGQAATWHGVDCKTGKVFSYAHGASNLYVGDAHYVGGDWDAAADKIYLWPCAQTTALHRIDCSTGSVEQYAGMSGRPPRFTVGGAFDPVNRRGWLAPAHGWTGMWSYVDVDAGKLQWYAPGVTGMSSLYPAYQGAVYSPSTRRVFFSPCYQYYQPYWHYVDCDTGEVCAYASGVTGPHGFTGPAYNGAVYDSVQDRVYLAPFTVSDTFRYIDCKTATVVSYQSGYSYSGVCHEPFQMGTFSPASRRIYLSYRNAPSSGSTGTWSYIDTVTNKLGTYRGATTPTVYAVACGGAYSPTTGRVYFAPYTGGTVSPWFYVQESAVCRDRLLPYRASVVPSAPVHLRCVEEAEVSMLCIDGSDRKGNLFQLHARFSDGQAHNDWCTWSSEDTSIAYVSTTGEVSGVSVDGSTLGKEVLVTATYRGVTSSTKVVVFATLPTVGQRYSLPGGCGEGAATSSIERAAYFKTEASPPLPLTCSRAHSRFYYSGGGYLVTSGYNHVGCAYVIQQQSGYLCTRVFNSATLGYTDYQVATALTSGALQEQDAVLASGSLYVGGTLTSTSLRSTGTFTEAGPPGLLFQKPLVKLVDQRGGSTGSLASLTANQCGTELYYCPQNYVRSSDSTGKISNARILNMGSLGSTYDIYATGPVPASWYKSFAGDTIGLLEAEVSMLCYDGSDGKGNAFQLHLESGGGISYNHRATWSSSDPTRAVVSSLGVVSAVAGNFGDVSIYCAYAGVTGSCLVTTYSTMPSGAIADQGLWAIKGGCGGRSTTVGSFVYFSGKPDLQDVTSIAVRGKRYATRADIHHGINDVVGETLVGRRFMMNSAYYNGRCGGGKHTSTTYSDAFVGEAPANGALWAYDIRNFGNTLYLNGTTYNPSYSTSASVPTPRNILAFVQTEYKIVSMVAGNSAVLPGYDVYQRMCYIPQNYVRCADRTVRGVSRVNYTVIPNIGTLGGAYDLTANNVPALWFGV